jgi:trigger factor
VQVSVTENSPTNMTMQVIAGSDVLQPIKLHVLGHFRNSVKVPGFRPGKAPAAMLEKHIDQRLLSDEFLEHAINELFRRAVEQEGVRPIGQPAVNLKKSVPYTNLEFEATFDVVGKIKLANYKNIKLPKPKVEIGAKEVTDVINSLRQKAAERVDVDRPAETGDEVLIDFDGTNTQGRPVAGAEGKDVPLILGSNTFIPGFETNLVGAKPGEKKRITVTFPQDYGVAALQNKKVSFSVDVKKVQELIEPKVDDKFAAKVGPFKSVTELKADIKKQIKAEKDSQAVRNYENELINQIAAKSEVQIPDSLVEDQIKFMEEDERRNLTYRGLTWQEHLDQEGITEEQHRQRQKPDAEARVKAGLVLSEISKLENIQVTPEELEVRLQILKGQYQDPQMQTELDKPENRRDIASRLLSEKTINKLTEYAKTS